MSRVETLVKKFNLQQHPEGGYYAEFYRSSDTVVPVNQKRYQKNTVEQSDEEQKIIRSATTSIYFLLDKENYSAWHVLKSDEIWHFYDGSPLHIHVIKEDGELVSHVLGNPTGEITSASFQVLLKAGWWFAAEVIDKTSFTLAGCTVSPGFDFLDFKLADKDELTAQFPTHAAMISKLTI